MTYVYRCLIVAAAQSVQAAAVSAQLGGAAAEGMFITQLSATGALPATHYISAGPMAPEFVEIFSGPEAMYAQCVEKSVSMTLEDCTLLLSGFDVSEENAYVAMARLGLQMIAEEL